MTRNTDIPKKNRKNLKKPEKTRKNPKKPDKTRKNPKKPEKTRVGWVFSKKPGFLPTLLKSDKVKKIILP